MLTSVRSLLAATALVGSAFAATAAYADEAAAPKEFTLSGNVALVTDYRFRGLSQSAGDPAIQGGITLSHSSGVYVGTWSSSTNFDNLSVAADDTYGSQELDLFGGWTGKVASNVTADVGLLYYAYPNGHLGHANFFEPYASLSTTYGPVTGKVGINYAWKQKALDFNGVGGSDDNVYVYGELGGAIPNTPVSLSAHLGYTAGALSPKFATGETIDYKSGFDYSVGASVTVLKNLSLGVAYVGVDGNAIDGYSNDTAVGTLKLSF
jgi:uncharacterized protein (TIGR02001 family)